MSKNLSKFMMRGGYKLVKTKYKVPLSNYVNSEHFKATVQSSWT